MVEPRWKHLELEPYNEELLRLDECYKVLHDKHETSPHDLLLELVHAEPDSKEAQIYNEYAQELVVGKWKHNHLKMMAAELRSHRPRKISTRLPI